MKYENVTNRCDEIERVPAQVRKIKPTRRSVSGLYSFRGEVAIPFESTLERDFISRCEFQLSILEVIPQPVKIPFIGSNGNRYNYTPDFLVYYKLGTRCHVNYPKPMLVEVKPKDEWKNNFRKWSPKWKAAQRYSIKQGWKFRIYDESRIRDTAFNNIKFLERYTRMAFEVEDLNEIINSVSEMGTCTVDYLLSRHYAGIYRNQGLAHIWNLLAMRKLNCDIVIPLNNLTELWLPENE